MLESNCPSSRTAADVSSQDVSIPRIFILSSAVFKKINEKSFSLQFDDRDHLEINAEFLYNQTKSANESA